VPVEQDRGSEGAGEYCDHFASFADWVAGTGRPDIGCNGELCVTADPVSSTSARD